MARTSSPVTVGPLCWRYRRAALAAADEEQLAEAAARWVELSADDGEEIHPEFASDMLSEVASLARAAAHRGHRLYYWWG